MFILYQKNERFLVRYFDAEYLVKLINGLLSIKYNQFLLNIIMFKVFKVFNFRLA